MIRRLLVVGVALLTLGAFASVADAATLRVSVTPSIVHRNQTYTITITGRYSRALRRSPWLLAFIQYTGKGCRSTATAEYQLPTREWSWVFYPQQRQPSSPFRDVFRYRARTRFGLRRVCAYLYRKKITPDTTDQPLATASAGFSEVRS